MSCYACPDLDGASRAQVVEDSEQVVSSTVALRLLDCTSSSGDSQQTRQVCRAILVRSRARKTEGALLILGQSACFRPRFLAAIPLCANIDLQVVAWDGAGSLLSFIDVQEGDTSKRVILQLPESAHSSLPAGPRSASLAEHTLGDLDEQEDGSSSSSSTQRFLKMFAAMQDIAERHGYVFPSQKGNHDWLWTYGADSLPLGFRDWRQVEEVVSAFSGIDETPTGHSYTHRYSMVGGTVNIRSFVAELGIPWYRAKPALLRREAEYLSSVPLAISVVTLNCGEQMPPPVPGTLTPLFANQIFGESSVGGATSGAACSSAGVIFVALQETCPLVVAVDITDTVPARHHAAWKEACVQTLAEFGDYSLVASVHLVGLLLMVFARSEHAGAITSIRTGSVCTGKGGLGNKGAVAASLLFHSTSMCFVNSHLAAGESKSSASDREKDVGTIVSELRLSPYTERAPTSLKSLSTILAKADTAEAVQSKNSVSTRNLFENDAVIWAGDLNMRLWKDSSMKASQDREEVFSCADGGDKQHEFMAQHDELHIQRAKGGLYTSFEEAPILFMPSYKLKPMPVLLNPNISHTITTPHPANEQYFYDRKRVPAWCDRILWRARGTMDITPHNYERIAAVSFSDHRPVRLSLTVVVKHVNWDQVLEICQVVREKADSGSDTLDRFARHDSIMHITNAMTADALLESPRAKSQSRDLLCGTSENSPRLCSIQ